METVSKKIDKIRIQLVPFWNILPSPVKVSCPISSVHAMRSKIRERLGALIINRLIFTAKKKD
jgi:hypothetical protein